MSTPKSVSKYRDWFTIVSDSIIKADQMAEKLDLMAELLKKGKQP